MGRLLGLALGLVLAWRAQADPALTLADPPARALAAELDRRFADGWQAGHGAAPDFGPVLSPSPFVSTVVLLVRRGNPKAVHDWPDLVRSGVSLVLADPRRAVAGRWAYLAAWAAALTAPGGGEAAADAYLERMFDHVTLLAPGPDEALAGFARRGRGDVLLVIECEAPADAALETVVPPRSILAEPAIAAPAQAAAGEAFRRFLATPEAALIAARHGFRPASDGTAARTGPGSPPLTLIPLAALGPPAALEARHFGPGGLFDRIWPEHP